ncbi:hypothetical protein I4U23_005118 [Adineta vaga]|nr:hypothetical protein I4U23_005118 [Adineta vaga]
MRNSMKFIYPILLLVIYVDTFVHCRRVYDHRFYRNDTQYNNSIQAETESCGTYICRLQLALFCAFIANLTVYPFVVFASWWLCKHGKKPAEDNDPSVHLTAHNIDRQEDLHINPIQSGIWSSQYFHDRRWHGPNEFPLVFNSQTKKIKGAGSDDGGIFIIEGSYSTETNRIKLTKGYRSTPSNREDLGFWGKIILIWKPENNQFEDAVAILTDRNVFVDIFPYPFAYAMPIFQFLHVVAILTIISHIFNCKIKLIKKHIQSFVRKFRSRRTTFSQTTNDSIWNIEFGDREKPILTVQHSLLCERDIINPIPTTSSFP